MFSELNSVKIGVIGDFCLDVYWYADMTKSELSRETAHYPLPVVREKMSPGGAGNVANNLTALKLNKVYAIGVAGSDWRGGAMLKELEKAGVDTSLMITVPERFTNTYIKPNRFGYSGECTEDARIDFEARTPLDSESEKKVLAALDEIKDKVDVLCVCDQMKYGCITDAVRDKICALGKDGLKIIVDSRDRIGLYENVTVKPNDIEAARAAGESDPAKCAEILSQKTGRPAIVTCGADGCVIFENGKAAHIDANKKLSGETDICGAGDTFLSAAAAFTAAGKALAEAAVYANAASCVTVHKVGMTGTATREEICAIL